jgi:gamma-glutamyl-gamma-aminobutyrate hydrolase PuuD
MKIAVTQNETTINGRVYDCLEPNWYDFLAGHEIVVVPNIGSFDLSADLIVFSGGRNIANRRATEVACYDYAIANNIPMLGICHGAFFLNYMLGGKNGKIDGHWRTEHTIMMEDSTHTINSYHRLCLEELGPDTLAIASTDSHCEGFKHTSKSIWGIVWHPERMAIPVLPKDIKELLNG